MRAIQQVCGIAVVLVLTACATPRYQTVYRYEPPVEPQGVACLQSCEQQKVTCQADCKSRYQSCQKDIAPLAEERYLLALKQYEAELKSYAHALQHHEMQRWMHWSHDYWPPHRGSYHYPWPAPYYPPPYLAPIMPTREGVRAALEKERCQADCGCLPAFDACYVGCGGRRIPETLCIRNCEPVSPRPGSAPR